MLSTYINILLLEQLKLRKGLEYIFLDHIIENKILELQIINDRYLLQKRYKI